MHRRHEPTKGKIDGLGHAEAEDHNPDQHRNDTARHPDRSQEPLSFNVEGKPPDPQLAEKPDHTAVELVLHPAVRRHQEEVAWDCEVVSDLRIALKKRDHWGVSVVMAQPSIDPIDRATELRLEALVQLPKRDDDFGVGGC